MDYISHPGTKDHGVPCFSVSSLTSRVAKGWLLGWFGGGGGGGGGSSVVCVWCVCTELGHEGWDVHRLVRMSPLRAALRRERGWAAHQHNTHIAQSSCIVGGTHKQYCHSACKLETRPLQHDVCSKEVPPIPSYHRDRVKIEAQKSRERTQTTNLTCFTMLPVWTRVPCGNNTTSGRPPEGPIQAITESLTPVPCQMLW